MNVTKVEAKGWDRTHVAVYIGGSLHYSRDLMDADDREEYNEWYRGLVEGLSFGNVVEEEEHMIEYGVVEWVMNDCPFPTQLHEVLAQIG